MNKIFYGVAPERLGLMADAHKVKPKTRNEYPPGAKRYSRGEPGQVTKPGADGRRIGRGEPPVGLQDDDEKMMARKIRRNLGLQPVDDEESEGATALDSNIGGKSTMTIKQLVAEVTRLKRERVAPQVDRAIANGQIAVNQRAWAIRCAAETPEHWAKFLAVTPSSEAKAEAKICRNLGLTSDGQLERFMANKERRERGVLGVAQY